MSRELTSKAIMYEFKLKDINSRGEIEYVPEYGEVYNKIQSALEIEKTDYNVYLIDDFSKDKLKNIMSFIEKKLEKKKAPKDICYVVWQDAKSPKALFLPKGKGNELKDMVEEIQNSFAEYTFDFYNSGNNKDKEIIVDNIQKKRNELMGKLDDLADEYGFEIRSTQSGFAFIPLKEGEVMSEKDYDTLGKDRKDDILDKVNVLKSNAQTILEDLKTMEIDEIEKIKKIMTEYYELKKSELKSIYDEGFEGINETVEFLDYICTTISNEIIENYTINYEEDEEKINEIIYRYGVNVIVDNSENDNPQVIFEEDPSISNLIGSIEYENHNNVYTTDVTLIKAGSLLKANEGCLIIRTNSLLTNPQAYFYLKKALLNEKIEFNYDRGYLELLSLNGLKPEQINIKEKVILIGDYETYDLLYNYDEDFRKIFKIRAEYKPVVEINDETKKALVGNISMYCTENNLKPLKEEAIKEVAKFLSRKAEHRNKMYFDDCELSKILMLSNNIVVNENREIIGAEDIRNVAYSEEQIEKEILDSYKNKKILINIKDESIGQINGLSVIDTGYFSFGKPIRITCTCYKGDGNIVDVQKESNLSGNIHSKSINILKGYINKLIGSYSRIPVDFHLCFEQLYGKIDGDSASVAEITSMISALSKIPIRQNIAVTGSINQFGEVQPIGGVNEKIEGFYKTCKVMGDIQGKGVLIPSSNKDDLVLSEEVEREIFKGNFHIYTMDKVEDAIETLMGTDKLTVEDIISAMIKESKKYTGKKSS